MFASNTHPKHTATHIDNQPRASLNYCIICTYFISTINRGVQQQEFLSVSERYSSHNSRNTVHIIQEIQFTEYGKYNLVAHHHHHHWHACKDFEK